MRCQSDAKQRSHSCLMFHTPTLRIVLREIATDSLICQRAACFGPGIGTGQRETIDYRHGRARSTQSCSLYACQELQRPIQPCISATTAAGIMGCPAVHCGYVSLRGKPSDIIRQELSCIACPKPSSCNNNCWATLQRANTDGLRIFHRLYQKLWSGQKHQKAS